MKSSGSHRTDESRRKALHLSTGAIPVAGAVFGATPLLNVLYPFLGLVLLFEYLRRRYRPVQELLKWLCGPMMRPDEFEITSRPVLFGFTYELIAAVLLFSLFPLQIAVVAFGMMVLGDPLAALVGGRFGRIRIFGGPKTLEGSVAFFLGAFLVSLLASDLTWTGRFAASISATIGEALPIHVDDNILAPLAAACVLSLF